MPNVYGSVSSHRSVLSCARKSETWRLILDLSGFFVSQDLGTLYNEFWEPRRQLWCLINSDSNRIALACPCIFRCRHIFFPLQILAHNTGSSIHEHRPLALICSCSCSRVRRCVVSVASLYIRFGVRSNGGLLLGGTWVALTFPNDVAISVCAAFASHLKSFWRETLLLTFATTLAGFCCAYFAKRRVNVR